MSKIVITLTETRGIQVLVESPTIDSAIAYVNKQYDEGKLMLDIEDVQGVTFRVDTDVPLSIVELLQESKDSYLIDKTISKEKQ